MARRKCQRTLHRPKPSQALDGVPSVTHLLGAIDPQHSLEDVSRCRSHIHRICPLPSDDDVLTRDTLTGLTGLDSCLYPREINIRILSIIRLVRCCRKRYERGQADRVSPEIGRRFLNHYERQPVDGSSFLVLQASELRSQVSHFK